VQLAQSPFVEMYQWRQSDMHYYNGWARQIASGDWWSRTVPIPMHRWHREIAAAYLSQHPDARAAFDTKATPPGDGGAAEGRVWSHWMGAPRFYQDPLYPYLIAATYLTVGTDVRFVLAWQLAFGVLTNVLIWLLARRYFGDSVAAWSAALAILCGPLLFYEGMLLRDSLVVFASLFLVWLVDRAHTTLSWRWSLALGVVAGFSCVLKSSLIPLAAVLTLVLASGYARRGRWWPICALAIGAAIGLGPAIVRNVALDLPALSMASSGPLTLVAANEPQYTPDVGFGINTTLLTAFLGDTDGQWRSAANVAMRGHTASSFAALLWRKWDRMWHWFEIPNNENYYYMKLRIPVLAWLPVTFALCAPLALVGLVLGARRIRQLWPLYALVALSAAPMIVFYVLGRFRAVLIAATIPFAALAIAHIVSSLRERRIAHALLAVTGVIVLAAWTGRPLSRQQVLLRTADWILPYSAYYQPRVYAALDRKEWSQAAAWYLEFFERYEPDPAWIAASDDRSLAPELADMHLECAEILKVSGQAALAQSQIEAATRLQRSAGR
jgi:hypothetical protein